MNLSQVDVVVVAGYLALTLAIGLWASRRAGKSESEFFLSGRSMPWWLLGLSMVATTFSTDTPNLVTDIVRTNGIAGNWAWWAFLLTGMATVFFFARLWRRSGVLTDLEFYELRYSGRPAAFLRDQWGEHRFHPPEGKANVLLSLHLLQCRGLRSVQADDGRTDPRHGRQNDREACPEDRPCMPGSHG